MHKHAFGPSHKEARTCNSVPAVVPVVLLAAGDCVLWHNCPFDPEILASHEARSCCRPCDRRVEERWRMGWARVRVWKWTRTLKLNKCSLLLSLFSILWFVYLFFYSMFSLSPQIGLMVLISAPFLCPTCILWSLQASLLSLFALTPFSSLSVVFHCGLMRGTWRKTPPHLFVCLWESYFLSTEGFWAADFLFSPDERQMFRNPLSFSFGPFLGFSKIWWLKAAWYQSKNDITAFYFQASSYSQGHITLYTFLYICTGVCMCTGGQCFKCFVSASWCWKHAIRLKMQCEQWKYMKINGGISISSSRADSDGLFHWLFNSGTCFQQGHNNETVKQTVLSQHGA